MEVLLGLTGRDYCIIAASKAAMRGATILKAHDDKTRKLSATSVLAFSGEAGDTVQFAEYIQANVNLYAMRHAHALQPPAIASFTRAELARALRSRKPYNVNLLLGGVIAPASTTASPATTSTSKAENDDAATKAASAKETDANMPDAQQPAAPGVPKLYWIDYLASCAEVPYAAHGYAQYYCLSILDKHHHPDMSLEQGLKCLRLCADELRRRLPIDFKGLTVKLVTASGIEELPWEDDLSIKAP